jgi:N-acetylmuramoyl-L-alanine amidase
MFRLALGAGHGDRTYGKRIPASLDPNRTSEWWLNDRICDHIETILSEYDGIEILRLDDSDDGYDNVPLLTRVTQANLMPADFYLSIHHNAGINGGTGGGIVVYRDPNDNSEETVSWQEEIYAALIAHTGLRGNRSNPMAESNLYEVTKPDMPAILCEMGFMDSATDVPIILCDWYPLAAAMGIAEVIVKKTNLKKKGRDEVTQEQFNEMMDNWLKQQGQKPPAAWSKTAREWAEGIGLIAGDGQGNMMYGSPVTREQLIQFLYRLENEI